MIIFFKLLGFCSTVKKDQGEFFRLPYWSPVLGSNKIFSNGGSGFVNFPEVCLFIIIIFLMLGKEMKNTILKRSKFDSVKIYLFLW